MRWLTYGFFVYALLNVAYFMITGQSGPRRSDPVDAAILRAFSGHWMAVYSAAMSVSYSAYRVPFLEPRCQCVQEHPVSPLAMFCKQCGKRLRPPPR
jgi:hypothetical protein